MHKNFKVWQYQVLVRMLRNVDSCILLVGGQVSSTTLEKSHLETQPDSVNTSGPSNSTSQYHRHFALRHRDTHKDAHCRVIYNCNKIRKQSVCLSIVKQIKKLRCFHTMGYSSSGKMNEPRLHGTTWTNHRK